jgi:lysophospholipase L1-like esterase
MIGNLAISIAAVAISLLAAEWAAGRFYQELAPEGGRRVVERALGGRAANDWLYYKSHPYMLYVLAPGFRDTNSRGYRGREFALAPGPKTLRILALGGSTTWGQGVAKADLAWPAQLMSMLNSRGARVEVINGGLPAGTSAEIVAQYVFKHQALKPDIVILHVGWNDVTPLFSSSYQPDYGDFRGWKSPPIALREGETWLLRFNLARVAYAWWFRNTAIDRFIIANPALTGISGRDALANVRKNQPVGFRRNISATIALARAQGARVIIFPTNVAPSRKIFLRAPAPNAERAWAARMLGLAKNRRVLAELAVQENVARWALPDRDLPMRVFVDHAHTNAEGHRLKAAMLADRLCEAFPGLALRVAVRCRR